MINREELFARFKREWDSDQQSIPRHTLSKYISIRYAEVLSVQKDIRDIDIQEEKAEKAHENKMESLQNSRQAVQACCKHESTTYHGDASGGSDSMTFCNICGVEVDR